MLCEAFPMQHDYEGKIWRSLVITGMGLTAIATLLALQRSSWKTNQTKNKDAAHKNEIGWALVPPWIRQWKKREKTSNFNVIKRVLFTPTTYNKINSSPHKFILLFDFSFLHFCIFFTTMMNLKIVNDDYKIKYFCMKKTASVQESFTVTTAATFRCKTAF